jgi:hypothetical protein
LTVRLQAKARMDHVCVACRGCKVVADLDASRPLGAACSGRAVTVRYYCKRRDITLGSQLYRLCQTRYRPDTGSTDPVQTQYRPATEHEASRQPAGGVIEHVSLCELVYIYPTAIATVWRQLSLYCGVLGHWSLLG